MILGTVLAAGLVAAAGLVGRIGSGDRQEGATGTETGQSTQQTWLLIGTVEGDVAKEANWLMLFSWEREDKEGFILYLPRSVLVEIPGFGGGPDILGKALALGQEPTLLSAATNLLGIRFDHHLKISDQGMRALFDKVGGVTIEVDQRLTRRDPDGKVRVVFAEGKQHLDGGRVSEYLTFLDEGGDEISRAVRHATIWSALLNEFRSKGASEFSKVLVESKDLFTSDVGPEEVAKFFEPFVSQQADSVQFETLPVQAQAVQSGSQLYGPDAEAIERMVDRYLAGSRPSGGGRSGKRMQILNGNGTPGIGEEVAGKLLPKGFQLVLDANANRFDYEKTQIVVYSDSKQAQSIAQEIRDALGVGEVVISRQKQSIVDVTIVVGKDYLNQR